MLSQMTSKSSTVSSPSSDLYDTSSPRSLRVGSKAPREWETGDYDIAGAPYLQNASSSASTVVETMLDPAEDDDEEDFKTDMVLAMMTEEEVSATRARPRSFADDRSRAKPKPNPASQMNQKQQWDGMMQENEALKAQVAKAKKSEAAAMERQKLELEQKHQQMYTDWEQKNYELREMLESCQAEDDRLEDQQIAGESVRRVGEERSDDVA